MEEMTVVAVCLAFLVIPAYQEDNKKRIYCSESGSGATDCNIVSGFEHFIVKIQKSM